MGSNATCLEDILEKRDDAVLKAIQEGIDRTNKRATSRAQNIQKWSILPRDFSVGGGELGTLTTCSWLLAVLWILVSDWLKRLNADIWLAGYYLL